MINKHKYGTFGNFQLIHWLVDSQSSCRCFDLHSDESWQMISLSCYTWSHDMKEKYMSSCHVLIVTTCVFFCRFPSISQDYKNKRQRKGLQILPSVRFCELLGGFFVDTAHLYCSGIATSCTKYAPKNVPWPVRLRICNEKLFGDGNHFLGLKHHV